MFNVALLTAAHLPNGGVDTPLLQDALGALGTESALARWDNSSEDWRRYDLVLLHTPWDYSNDPQRFLMTLQTIGASTTMVNPFRTVQWNHDKRYLVALAREGVPVPPSVAVSWPPTTRVKQELRQILGRSEVVVKPVVGAGGRGARLFQTLDEALHDSDAYHAGSVHLFQEFVPEIMSGEYSAVFFDGVLSHAALKTPGRREFRVQEHFGGSVTSCTLPADHRRFAEGVADLAPGETTYARIDFTVAADGRPRLMELEVVEPDLFLRTCPEAAERMATALHRRLESIRKGTV